MEVLKVVIIGTPWTILITAAAFLFGVIGGIPLVFARRSRFRLVRGPTILVIDFLRAFPPIVWLFIIYFGLSVDFIRLSPLNAALVGFGVISTAYLAEIYRGSILAVNRGQWEAAQALGLSRFRVFVDIIAPQAVRVAIPASATYVIGLLKDSAIASTIGVQEITFHASREALRTLQGLQSFGIAAVVYILLSLPLSWLSRRLDARFRASR